MPRFPAVFLFLLFHSGHTACPEGTVYEESFKKCYGVSKTPTSFLVAEQECIAVGGHLVGLMNAYEGSFVAGLFYFLLN